MLSLLVVDLVGFQPLKTFARINDVQVTLIDRRNYHLFQPLLYQVAMAGSFSSRNRLSPTSTSFRHKNIEVLMGEVQEINKEEKWLSN